MSTQHRARGYGRYRAAPPRHAARRPGPRTPLLITAAGLSVVSTALIGAALVHAGTSAPPTFTLPRAVIPPAAAAVPVPFEPDRSVARAVRQKAKERPQILLGTPSAADLTRFCVSIDSPLTEAVADGTDWICRPLLSDPVPVPMDDACRFLFDNPDAYAEKTGLWRCYRDGP